jgi:glucose dehydrogenase
MRDPAANFAAFKTYGWIATATPDRPLGLNDQAIRSAISSELQRRGYVESADQPDLRIAFETASTQKVENNPVRIGLGIGSWGSNVGGSVNVGSPSVRSYQEGTLVIRAVDAARNAEVWQGSVSSKLGTGGADSASLSQAVARAMKDFPARP